MLQVNITEKGILLFRMDDNLKLFSKSTTFYVDIFILYKGFYQFFTIHVMKNNHHVPLVFT
jgi:ABC-type arginine/histidine transport system permease subunit